MKATSNQNASPWTWPVCCMSNDSGIMMSWRSDSFAVIKSMVYFCDCDMHTCVSNVSCKLHTHSFTAPTLSVSWQRTSSLQKQLALAILTGSLWEDLSWKWPLSVSLRFNSHFPGGPGLADTRMFPFSILLEPRIMEMVVTTGAIRRAKF